MGEFRRRWLPVKMRAADHREAYAMWAEHFDDPALMANRDAKSNRRKLERVAAELPVKPSSAVLDVGPGDGTLFRIVADRVARCCGVDPSACAVSRLNELFVDEPRVEFVVGTANSIPYGNAQFDIVVINSVLQVLATDDIAGAIRELVRVCRPGGMVFVGELPFRAETDRGLLVHLARNIRESGPANLSRLLLHVYLIPLLRREPILLYPTTNTHVRVEEFETMCHAAGVRVETRRHRELRRESTTRNDYRLYVSVGASPDAPQQ